MKKDTHYSHDGCNSEYWVEGGVLYTSFTDREGSTTIEIEHPGDITRERYYS